MASLWRDHHEKRFVRPDTTLFRIPRHAYQDAPEQERCELILWVEADWRCEYWLLGESGVMRLLNGGDTILEVPVTDAITALQDVRMWHEVVLHGEVPTRA